MNLAKRTLCALLTALICLSLIPSLSLASEEAVEEQVYDTPLPVEPLPVEPLPVEALPAEETSPVTEAAAEEPESDLPPVELTPCPEPMSAEEPQLDGDAEIPQPLPADEVLPSPEPEEKDSPTDAVAATASPTDAVPEPVTVVTLSTPVLKKAALAAKGVAVTWNAVEGAEKYRVFRKVTGGGWKKVGDTTATSYLDATAKSGTKYAYTVRCITADGSDYASSYDKKGKTVTYIAAPVLKGAASVNGGVKIKWKASGGAENYRVFRKTGTGSWKKLADTTSTSYIDKTAKSGVTYSYTVRCLTANGKSYSSAYDKTGKTVTYIAAPVLKTAKNTAAGQVTVTWAKSAGAARYRVFRKTAGGSWAKVGDTTKTSYVDKTAKKGVTYYYTVRCISADKKSYTSAYNTAGLKVPVTK